MDYENKEIIDTADNDLIRGIVAYIKEETIPQQTT